MTLKGFFRILRPLNVLISILVVVVGLRLSRTPLLSGEGILAMMVISLLTAYSNISNDYFDRELDRKGHPSRPMVRGEVTPGGAILLSILSAILVLILSYLLGPFPFLYAVLLLGFVYVYNRWLKGVPLFGNLLVSFVAGSAFLFVGTFTGRFKPLLFPFLLAFVFHVGREVLKDLEDLVPDREQGIMTLPNLLGEERTIVFARLSLFLLIVVSIIPLFLGIYGWGYYLPIFLGMDIPVLYILFLLRRQKEALLYGRVSTLLKVTIFPALLGLYLGGLA